MKTANQVLEEWHDEDWNEAVLALAEQEADRYEMEYGYAYKSRPE